MANLYNIEAIRHRRSKAQVTAQEPMSPTKPVATTADNIVGDHKSKNEHVQPHEVQIDMAPDPAAKIHSQANTTAHVLLPRRDT